MHFYFVDLNPEVTAAWQQVFVDVPQVSIYHGSIFDHPADALMNPANSFGYMNGGIDFAISKRLGWHRWLRGGWLARQGSWGCNGMAATRAASGPLENAGFA